MRDIKDYIVQAHDETGPEALLPNFKSKSDWVLLLTLAMSGVLLMTFNNIYSFMNEWLSNLISLSIILVGILGCYYKFNTRFKKDLIDLNITPSPGNWTFWSNRNFREFSLNSFNGKLIEVDLLTGTEKDIALLKNYLEYFEVKPDKSSNSPGKFVYGSLIITLSVPLWNNILAAEFRGVQGDNMWPVVYNASAILFVVGMGLFGIGLLKMVWQDYNNKDQRKYLRIAERLKHILSNVILKHGK